MSLFDDPPPAGAPRRKASARRTEPGEHAKSTEPTKSEPQVLSVGSLTRAIEERLVGLGRLAVEGELMGCKRAASGHVYFSLKDENAVVNCVIWRSRAASAARFELKDGMRKWNVSEAIDD